MRYPITATGTKEAVEKNWYVAQGFGASTSYGFHEGIDYNLLSGGDSDLGQPIYAIADGYVTSVCQNHVTKGFGRHIHIRHEKEECWSHCAHLKDIVVSENDTVKEGQLIGHVGKSGNAKYAHLHFSIKIKPTGIDGIAKTKEDLEKWTDPLAFIDKWNIINEGSITPDLDIRIKYLDENKILTEGDLRAVLGSHEAVPALKEDLANANKEIERLREEFKRAKEDLQTESSATIALKEGYENHLQSIGKALNNGSDLPGILQQISILSSEAEKSAKFEKENKALRNHNADLKAEIEKKADECLVSKQSASQMAVQMAQIAAILKKRLKVREMTVEGVLEALESRRRCAGGRFKSIINKIKKWKSGISLKVAKLL